LVRLTDNFVLSERRCWNGKAGSHSPCHRFASSLGPVCRALKNTDLDDVAQTWYLAYVTVRVEGSSKKQLFPHYKWIFGSDVDLFEAVATLPQNDTLDPVRHTRSIFQNWCNHLVSKVFSLLMP
jgi:hypothetical protein